LPTREAAGYRPAENSLRELMKTAAFGLLVRAPEAANSAMFFQMFLCYASPWGPRWPGAPASVSSRSRCPP
jgi:hypothetical protein